MDAKKEMLEKAHKIQEEVEKKKEEKAVAHADIVKKSQSQMVQGNPELLKMFADTANAGTEGIGGKSPQLKIHATGRSSVNQLANGAQPNDGWLFYQPTGEQFKEVECHIIAISRGYYVPDTMNPAKKQKYNTLMAGVITNQGSPKFFIMYLNGLKLAPMWAFGEEAGKYKRNAEMRIPMYALKVKLAAKQVQTDKGFFWIPTFDILKNEDGSPVIITDMRSAKFLNEKILEAKEMFSVIMEAKATDEQPEPEALPESKGEDPKSTNFNEAGEVINPEDIPF